MTTISNFNTFNAKDTVSTIKAWINNFNLLSFYYKSHNSTDGSLLEVLPVGLIDGGPKKGFQLLAIKIVDNKFAMRRYNLSNVSYVGISDNDCSAWEYALWENLHLEKDTIFVTDLSDALLAINWGDWKKNLVDRNEKIVDTVVLPNSIPVSNLGENAVLHVDENDAVFLSMASNPGTYFIPGGVNVAYHMSKKTVDCSVINQKAMSRIVVSKGLVYGVLDIGDAVTINAPKDSEWGKLVLTIENLNEDKTFTVIGIDKNLNIYRMILTGNYLILKKKKNSNEVVKKVVPDSKSWD